MMNGTSAPERLWCLLGAKDLFQNKKEKARARKEGGGGGGGGGGGDLAPRGDHQVDSHPTAIKGEENLPQAGLSLTAPRKSA